MLAELFCWFFGHAWRFIDRDVPMRPIGGPPAWNIQCRRCLAYPDGTKPEGAV